MKWLSGSAGALLALAGLGGCAIGVPSHAARHEPPTGIEQHAVSVGTASRADFTLAATNEGPWTLSEKVRQAPLVLVFYRGHW